MPKDPVRNQPNYKIGGGQLNEFDYARNQGAMTEAEHERFQQQQAERAAGEESAAQSAPQTEAERIQQLMADVHEKVARRKQKAQGAASSARPAARKGGAKKSASRASTKKSAQKGGAKKSAAKAGAKKGAARAGASKSASKAGAKKRAPGAVKQSGAKGGGKGWGSKKSARAASGRAGGKKGARKSAR